VSKLSNQDIRGIINQWKRRRPVREIAEYHQGTRQRIYQIISFYKKNRFYPYPSRLITCYGVFDRPTTEHTIQVLENGFQEYGVPEEILTDNGSHFVSSRNPETADHTFRKFLEYHGIRHIRARVNHPQTNGKIERFFGEVERRTPRFGSVERVVHWHNEIKPHCSLDYDDPAHAFWYRLPLERILGYAQRWIYAEG